MVRAVTKTDDGELLLFFYISNQVITNYQYTSNIYIDKPFSFVLKH